MASPSCSGTPRCPKRKGARRCKRLSIAAATSCSCRRACPTARRSWASGGKPGPKCARTWRSRPRAAIRTTWRQVAGAPEALSTDYPHHAGIYLDGDKLLAVNRAEAEDQAAVLPDDRVAGLFKDLDFTRVDDRAGSLVGLIQEIWRLFLMT